MGVERVSLRAQLQAGADLLLGVFITLRCTPLVEMAGLAGLDFVVVDMEHTLLSEADVEDMARAGAAAGVKVLVRVRDRQPEAIGRVVETGVDGIMVPMVNTAAEAAAAIRAAYLPPRGSRGQSSLSRAAGFSIGPKAPDPFCAVEVESPSAVENLAQILAVPGLDMVFLGPGDLRNGLLSADGPPEDVDANLAAAVAKVVLAMRSSEKSYLGVPATYPSLGWTREQCLANGARMATLGSDVGAMAGGFRRLAIGFRG